LCLSALGQDRPAKTDKPAAASAVFDTSFDPTLKESMSAGRSAHQDEKVVGEVAPGLKDEKVQEHGHDPMEGPDLEVVSNKLDFSQRVVENQKQMLATVQSLIELVCLRTLSGFVQCAVFVTCSVV
jgi:hypothetical protein